MPQHTPLHRRLPLPRRLLRTPLGGFDLVLGVDWLHTLGPILWDFNRHSVTVVLSGSQVTWTGLAAPALPVVRMITSVDSSLMGAMLEEFADLFTTPIGPPPARSRDHSIRLLPRYSPHCRPTLPLRAASEGRA